MITHRLRIIAGALLVLAAHASAAVIASSTFTTGDEGWKNGNFDATTVGQPGVTWSAVGGNPGGYISVIDNFDWNAFLAPAAYLGNQSAAYGGTLTFDLYDVEVDFDELYAAVMLSDGVTFLFGGFVQSQYPLGPPFSPFNVSLLASAGWRTTPDPGSAAASEAQLQTVLGNLHILAISADWKTGNDNVALDNVVLNSGPGSPSAVPEPGTFALVAGAAALTAFRISRRC